MRATKLLDAALRHRDKRLPGDIADAVAAYGAKATWPAGFVVYQRGAQADGMFIVVRGRIVLRSRVKASRARDPQRRTAIDLVARSACTRADVHDGRRPDCTWGCPIQAAL